MNQSTRIPDTHAEAWAMLPFLANGRIAPEDREWVELHVQGCSECRRELDEQRAIAAQMREAEPPFAGSEQRAFAKLWTRIEAAERAIPTESEDAQSGPGDRTVRGNSPRTVRWLAAAVIVQAIGLAALGFVALNRSGTLPSGEYQTVSNVPEQVSTAPAVRLMFAPETSVEAMGAILASHGLELVAGPGDAGIFTAALPANSGETPKDVATALRADPRVHFAEPVMH